ncbi:MAG: hypothetical protein E7K44_11610 [Staphylococcus lugdunensis]|nr:hypothetical protein [Staphylococcus lugdunensis]
MCKYIKLDKIKDEREQYNFNYVLSRLFLFNYVFSLLMLFIILIMNIVKETFTVESFLILIIVLVSSISLIIGLNKANLDKFVVSNYSEYKRQKRNLKLTSFVSSVIFLVLSFLLDYLHSVISNSNVISSSNFLIWIVSSVIFGALFYLFFSKKIKIDDNED